MLSSTGIGSSDGVERVLLEDALRGNRNHTVLRFAMFIKDEGYNYRDAKEKTIEFNRKLPEPLSDKELRSTILKSLERKYDSK